MAAIEKSSTAKREEETLAFWKEKDIFKKTLEKPASKGEFVFYEGPPTANGHPAIHHLEARAFKDLIPRYKAMRGYHVRRKAGWDTHGLPVELEVEKEIGSKSKKDIEAYGVAAFNKKCKESVLRYVDEWKEFTDRIGFWVDHDSTYFTFDNEYIESVWGILKRVHERGLLYKDYRVVPWCARCGTPLSSHEVADGYKDVTDTSVYVLFKIVGRDEYFAAWTTTPWTLPGNVALAVGENIPYGLFSIDGKKIWMGSARGKALFPESQLLEEKTGVDLTGWEYEPLFPYMRDTIPESEREKLGKVYKIYTAPFVGEEDGTGIVHTAVMYGADDFELGTKIGFPKYHLVNEEGKFIDAVTDFAGVFVKDADEQIINALGIAVLKTESVTHAYPHCWRCKRPLIYYARDSWYIRMSELRADLMAENQKIHWEPEHIRDGRFGEWLKEVKDWAISRNRYWGTPLPIYRSESGKTLVVGSLAELRAKAKRSGNTYLLMRHGEAETNATGRINSDPSRHLPLTERGRRQVEEAAQTLRGTKIDYIYASPLARTQETATIVASALGIPAERIITDVRLVEIGVGVYEGKLLSEYNAAFPNTLDQFEGKPEGGENWSEVKRRAGAFLFEVEKKHQACGILIVSHGDTTWLMQAAAKAASKEETLAMLGELKNAEVRTMEFTPLPVNEDFELDVHRPYLDALTLTHDGEEYQRVPEVLDVWFDSGAMPFAQDHYPFENRAWIEGAGYPADYISEAIDQTRGWFYTLHAIGVLMERGAAYKNVICLGHLLDKKGKKMSKSQGNVINPWDMLPKYGADALRFWMYTVNEPGASKNFDEKVVDEMLKKNTGRLLNVLSFYQLFKSAAEHAPSAESGHVLDRWMVARLRELVRTVSASLDAYQVDRAARPLADFIDDLSTWYLRRSRERIKGEDKADVRGALGTLQYVLVEFSKVSAPFMPFLSEHLYQAAGGKKESVHLEDWPEAPSASEEEKQDMLVMRRVRDVVSIGMEIRAAANKKVRQPLLSATLNETYADEFSAIMRDELNVKEIKYDRAQKSTIVLDTTITEELKREGDVRDFLRAVQELRKKKGLKPGEKAVLVVATSVEGRTFVEEEKQMLMKTTALSAVEYNSADGEEINIGGWAMRLELK